MNIETLERLVIDRASGELPDDAAQLLDAALADHPDWAAAAAQIEKTLALAKKVLPPPPAQPLPAPRFHANVVPLPAARPALNWAVGLAAGLALGALFTYLTIPKPAPSPPAPINQGAVAVSPLPAPQRQNVVWTSPVRMPQLRTAS